MEAVDLTTSRGAFLAVGGESISPEDGGQHTNRSRPGRLGSLWPHQMPCVAVRGIFAQNWATKRAGILARIKQILKLSGAFVVMPKYSATTRYSPILSRF